MTTVAVFGGSFNPPHVAHVLAVAYVLSTSDAERVLVVPAHKHPFGKPLAPFDDRVRMAELALEPLPGASVSRIEETLDGLTLHTLEALKKAHPEWSLRLVMGADILLEADKWFRFDDVKKLAPPIVLGRAGVISLVALGLAGTPVLASGTVGAIWLYGRRLRVGEYVELGAYRGRVSELNLLELRLTVTDRTELRVPHLLTLVRPLRLLGARPRLTLDVYVHAGTSVTDARSLLASVAGKVGTEPSVEIVSADADAIRFRIAATCESLDARTAFHIAALDALSNAGITLGRDRA